MMTVIGTLCLSVLLIYSFTIYKIWNWYIAGFFQLPGVPMSFTLGVVLIGTLVIQGVQMSAGKQIDKSQSLDLIFDRGKRRLWPHILLGIICLAIGYIGNLLLIV